MNERVIAAFIDTLRNVLATLAAIEVRYGAPQVKQDRIARGDVTGLIGLNGDNARGSLALTFTEELILTIVQRVFGERPRTIDAETRDMVGEITNMVTGGAKAVLGELGYDFAMSVPTVLSGTEHEVRHETGGETVLVPVSTADGDLFVEICLETAA